MDAQGEPRVASPHAAWLRITAIAFAMVALGLLGFFGTLRLLDQERPRGIELQMTEAFMSGSSGTRALRQGWSAPEPWGTWSNGPRAELALTLEKPTAVDVEMTLEARAFPHHKDNLQRIHVAVNGSRVATLQPTLEGLIRNETIRISANIANQRSPMLVVFEVTRPTSPSDLKLGADDRKLGIGLISATLRYRALDGRRNAELIRKHHAQHDSRREAWPREIRDTPI